MLRTSLAFSAILVSLSTFAADIPPDILRKAANVKPSPQQFAWQELEYTCFVHFGVNTFTDREWGEGKEDPKIFNPTALDCNQWAEAAKVAGMKLLILTCKHHDGFCLWPSQYTEHSVKNSPWRDGKGDVVKEAAEACRKAGIKFGVYLSPWDRNAKSYGTDAYNDYYKKQLTELLTNYGEITEVWWDGACGEGPNGKKQVYDWAGYTKVVRQLQPKALIFGMGPDIRWVGNEDGLARESEWSVLPVRLHQDQTEKDLGNRKYLAGAKELMWYPAECDVSIRPGWFYHAKEDEKVKSLKHMLDIWYRSVGRNSVLLVNVPPDRRGLWHENDVKRLKELRAVLDETFKMNLASGKAAKSDTAATGHEAQKAVDADGATWWQPAGEATSGSIEIDLGQPASFDRAMLQEMYANGQRVEAFTLEAFCDGQWKEVTKGTTIGSKRLLRFSPVTASRVRLAILDARDVPQIREFGIFKASPREE